MPTSYLYLAIMFVLLVASGLGEYFHLVPNGTFTYVFFLVIGLVAPSPFPHSATTVQTPQTVIHTEKVEEHG